MQKLDIEHLFTHFFARILQRGEGGKMALENLTVKWDNENLIQQLRLLGTLTQDYIDLGRVAQNQIQKLDVLFRVLLLVRRGLRESATSYQWRNRLSRE